jgi:hypothetical protein
MLLYENFKVSIGISSGIFQTIQDEGMGEYLFHPNGERSINDKEVLEKKNMGHKKQQQQL